MGDQELDEDSGSVWVTRSGVDGLCQRAWQSGDPRIVGPVFQRAQPRRRGVMARWPAVLYAGDCSLMRTDLARRDQKERVKWEATCAVRRGSLTVLPHEDVEKALFLALRA